MTILIWLIMGALGVLIYNNTFQYENKTIKYIWNVLVFLCGGIGLLTGCLTWIITKLVKHKLKNE